MSLWTLFLTFLQIGGCSIGGGYAVLPFIQDKVVASYHWLTVQEFSTIITISQMTPGPLAVNASTFVGMRLAGMPGAIVATVGCISIGVLLSYVIYRLFQVFQHSLYFQECLQGLKASSTGCIASAAVMLVVSAMFMGSELKLDAFQIMSCIIFIGVLFALRKYHVNPILLLVCSGMLGILFY